jgi:membrane protein DedA with SNARE-associated domain
VPGALLQWISTYGAGALFVLLMAGVFGLPVPDETLLTFAGVLVRSGHLHFATTWMAAALGSMCGITLSYIVGRTLGLAVVKRFGSWVHVTHDDVHRVEQWLERSGKWTLTFGYFIPGVRHLTAIVAGSTELPPPTFAVYAYGGAALWSLTFVTLGWYVGEEWQTALRSIHRHGMPILFLLAAAAIASVLLHRLRRK